MTTHKNHDPSTLMRELEHSLLSLDRLAARSILNASKGNPLQLVEEVITPVLEGIGANWERGQIALSQVYMAGRICEELVDELLPTGASSRENPPMAIAVLEDFHMLGKRIVYSALRSSGFHVVDYGRMTTDDLVVRTKHDGIKILLISTLMLPSALRVRDVRAGLDGAGMDTKILVGGAPFRFDDRLWKDVRAHACAPTASGAIGAVKEMMGEW